VIYKVAGLVRNPTEQTYAVQAIHVTFYDADGFRGAFYPFPVRGQGRPSGEYIWHGATTATFPCLMLAPGESCPFSVEIAAQNMASFVVHPDAKIAEWHVPVPVTLSELSAHEEGSYVRLHGTATNPNSFAIRNIMLAGVLLDDKGQTVSLGSGIIATLAAGDAAAFDVRVAKQSFATYQVYAQAEQ